MTPPRRSRGRDAALTYLHSSAMTLRRAAELHGVTFQTVHFYVGELRREQPALARRPPAVVVHPEDEVTL